MCCWLTKAYVAVGDVTLVDDWG